jgi:hypothetical protein
MAEPVPTKGDNPDNTSPFERLQNTIRQFHNKKLATQFADINDTNLTTQRGILKSDLTIIDNDTANMMIIKMMVFNDYIDNIKFYGIPVENYHANIQFEPQLHLLFIETAAAAKTAKRQRVRMSLNVRILSESNTTITTSDITKYTNEVNTNFPRSYNFDKGKDRYYYRELVKGYRLIITGQTETEVKTLITKVLSLQNHLPDWDFLTVSKFTDKNLSTAKYVTILNKKTKLPQYRPLAKLYLKRAELKLHGNLEDIVLVERYV